MADSSEPSTAQPAETFKQKADRMAEMAVRNLNYWTSRPDPHERPDRSVSLDELVARLPPVKLPSALSPDTVRPDPWLQRLDPLHHLQRLWARIMRR